VSLAIKAWYSELEKRSEGRFKVEHYWSCAIADALDIPGYVAQNIAQTGHIGGGYHPEKFRLIRVGNLPFLSDNADAVIKALTDAMRENEAVRRDFEEEGLKFLFMINADRAPLPSKKPAYKIEDLEGWKIRAYGPQAVVIENWGATPIGIPFNDIPEALERGVIDSATSLYFTSFYGMKIHELVRYAIDTGNRFVSGDLSQCMSLEFYNSLPDDLKAVVDGMVDDGYRIYAEQYAKEIYKEAELLAATEMEFIRWTPAEVERAKAVAVPAATKAFFEEMAERGVEDEARELYEWLKARIRKYEHEPIILPNSFDVVEQFRK